MMKGYREAQEDDLGKIPHSPFLPFVLEKWGLTGSEVSIFKIYQQNNQPFQKQQGISIYLERTCEMEGAFALRLVVPK